MSPRWNICETIMYQHVNMKNLRDLISVRYNVFSTLYRLVLSFTVITLLAIFLMTSKKHLNALFLLFSKIALHCREMCQLIFNFKYQRIQTSQFEKCSNSSRSLLKYFLLTTLIALKSCLFNWYANVENVP